MMKITKAKLKQIIREELGKVLVNEEESNKLDFLYDTDGVPGLLAHHKHFTANIDMQFKEYTQNLNNNLVKAVESGNIQDIKKYGHLALKDLNYQMPTSQYRQTQSALEQLDNISNASDQSEFGSKKEIGAEEIEKHVWQQAKPHARDDVYDAAIDVPLIQDAMGRGYYVVDPYDTGAFRTYIDKGGAKGPNGEEVIAPLDTLARGDQRINYFKTAHTNIYYRLVS